jgi:4-amino-4-deoxy-L-arabinose transferase-like glycosyltransferase
MAPARHPLDLDHGPTAWRVTICLTLGLTLLRLAALFVTRLELYPDEAQYWLWSRELRWGYVSKPPMIAWLIAATTGLGGQGEAWVRLGAPLAHAGAMLALYGVGRRLYGPAAGFVAAALYGLMPAVQVSALFIATDAPLMLFLALALWAYAELHGRPSAKDRRWIAAGLGLALGLAFLAKFAAVYLVIGLALHAILEREARRAWSGWVWAPALAGLLASFGPNLAWQASHGFATLAHTTEVNAKWSPGSLAHPDKLLEFVLGQFGVFGPIPFAVLTGGSVINALRRTTVPADRLLLCMALPPILIVSVQAFLSRAHAHWAATGYLAGAVLVAAWLLRWRSRGWSIAALALQGAVALLVLTVVAWPQLMDATGNGRRLARVRGWAETARLVSTAARAEQPTAVAVEDRYLFNELAYYGRGYFASPGAAPLRMRPAARALNEAQLSSPLAPAEAGKVLIVETAGLPPDPALPGDFERLQAMGRWVLPLGGKKTRDVGVWVAEGYRPVSGGAGTP